MTTPNDPRFEAFFEDGYARLVSGLAMVTGDRDVAAEAVAEAIARAWEHVRRGKEIDSLEAWVRTVALNCARRTFRRRASERKATDRLRRRPLEPVAVIEPGGNDRVLAALQELSRREREVAVMRFVLGLDISEIAAELSLSSGTVDNYLARARAKLARAIEQHHGGVVKHQGVAS